MIRAHGGQAETGPRGMAVLCNPDPARNVSEAFACIAAGSAFCIAGKDAAQGLERQCRRGEPEAQSGLEARMETPRFATLTGGSTGPPKVVLRSQESWIRSFRALEALGGTHAGDIVATLGALAHSINLYAALEALHLGAVIILLAGVRPDRQLREIRTRGATVVYATPSQIRRMRRLAPTDCAPSVRRVMIGGSACDAGTRALAGELFPRAAFVEFYGSAEASFVSLSDPDLPHLPGQPFPGVEVEIRDSDGFTLGAGKSGQIWVRSPMLFDGYLAQGTACSPAQLVDGFLRTGETGSLTWEGRLIVEGRDDRIVRIAEKSVALDEVEQRIASFKGVSHVAAVAVPDELRGMALAIAVMVKGETPIDRIRTDWHRFAGRNLKTATLVHLDHWPLLRSGKTDYSAIRQSLERNMR